MLRCVPRVLLVTGAVLLASAAVADSMGISLNLRAGVSAKRTDDEYFHLYQAGADVSLPQGLRWGSGWGVRTAFSVCAGVLRADRDNSFVFSVGPRVFLDLPDGILFITAGARAGVMSDHSLGKADLGGAFTFDTDVGIGANMGPNWSAGYRWQHFSNADIYGENPSINLHAVEVAYRF